MHKLFYLLITCLACFLSVHLQADTSIEPKDFLNWEMLSDKNNFYVQVNLLRPLQFPDTYNYDVEKGKTLSCEIVCIPENSPLIYSEGKDSFEIEKMILRVTLKKQTKKDTFKVEAISTIYYHAPDSTLRNWISNTVETSVTVPNVDFNTGPSFHTFKDDKNVAEIVFKKL